MSGKLCFSKATANAGAGHLRTSKAYCEGMNYRASGTALEKPVTDNPHVSGSDAEIAWTNGWAAAEGASPGALPATGCCAPTGVVAA